MAKDGFMVLDITEEEWERIFGKNKTNKIYEYKAIKSNKKTADVRQDSKVDEETG